MKRRLQPHYLVLATAVGAASAFAQADGLDGSALAASLQQTSTAKPNRVRVSYRAGFNVGVKFENLGGITPPAGANPGPATGYQENRTYEDGYNFLDDNNNTYGDLHATRNWGYTSASQISDTADSRFVAMHVTSAPATGATGSRDDDPLHGFEINYARELQDRGSWKWGVEAAFGFTSLDVTDASPVSGNVNRITDLFEVPLDEGTGDRYVPPAPYAGSDSPGPLLGSDPNRTVETLAGAATINGRRQFEANLFGFKVGPYVEIPVSSRLSVNVSGGLALVYVSSDLTFADETVTTDPSINLTQVHPGSSSSKSDLLPGGYVAANLAWTVDENWTIFAGMQFQGAGNYTHRDAGSQRAAVLDLGQTVFGVIGVGYSF